MKSTLFALLVLAGLSGCGPQDSTPTKEPGAKPEGPTSAGPSGDVRIQQIGTIPITGVDIPPQPATPGRWNIMFLARDQASADAAVVRISSFGPMDEFGAPLTTYTRNFKAEGVGAPPRPFNEGKLEFKSATTPDGKQFYVALLEIVAKGQNEASRRRTNVVFDVEVFPGEIVAAQKRPADLVIARALSLGF